MGENALSKLGRAEEFIQDLVVLLNRFLLHTEVNLLQVDNAISIEEIAIEATRWGLTRIGLELKRLLEIIRSPERREGRSKPFSDLSGCFFGVSPECDDTLPDVRKPPVQSSSADQ